MSSWLNIFTRIESQWPWAVIRSGGCYQATVLCCRDAKYSSHEVDLDQCIGSSVHDTFPQTASSVRTHQPLRQNNHNSLHKSWAYGFHPSSLARLFCITRNIQKEELIRDKY